MKRLLLWDIDGTLIRNKGAGKRAMNEAFAEVFGGVADAFDRIEMAGGLDLHFIHAVFAEQGIDPARIDEYLSVYYRVLEKFMNDGHTILMPGVREALERAAQDDRLYNALGTGNLEQGARIKMAVHDLNGYFPVGGFCEALTERYEMLQAGVRKAAAHYGVDFAPEEVIVIGDTLKDIGAARLMGSQVVALATGGNTYEDLQAAAPDLLLRDLSDAEPFFQYIIA